MYEKQNRFYADWRDRKGTRRRKAFLSAAEAAAYEDQQKAKARPGKERAQKKQSETAPSKRSQTGEQITGERKTQHSTTPPGR